MGQSSNTIRAGQMLHIALCYLERSIPQDRGGADTQVAPVGRRTCGMLIPRVMLPSALGYVLATLSGCLPWQDDERTRTVYLCLSPCDGCKNPAG